MEISLLISKIATGCWHLTGVVGLLWFCVKADSSSSAATMVTPGYSFILGLERCYTCQLSTGQNIQKSDCYSCSVQCRVNGPERRETSDNSIWFCAILSLKGLWGIISSQRRIVICVAVSMWSLSVCMSLRVCSWLVRPLHAHLGLNLRNEGKHMYKSVGR